MYLLAVTWILSRVINNKVALFTSWALTFHSHWSLATIPECLWMLLNFVEHNEKTLLVELFIEHNEKKNNTTIAELFARTKKDLGRMISQIILPLARIYYM